MPSFCSCGGWGGIEKLRLEERRGAFSRSRHKARGSTAGRTQVFGPRPCAHTHRAPRPPPAPVGCFRPHVLGSDHGIWAIFLSFLSGSPASPMGDILQTPQFQMRRLKKQLADERNNRDELELELAENRKLLTEKGRFLARWRMCVDGQHSGFSSGNVLGLSEVWPFCLLCCLLCWPGSRAPPWAHWLTPGSRCYPCPPPSFPGPAAPTPPSLLPSPWVESSPPLRGRCTDSHDAAAH